MAYSSNTDPFQPEETVPVFMAIKNNTLFPQASGAAE